MISNSASKQLLPGGAGCGKRTANTHSLPTGHAKANLFWGKNMVISVICLQQEMTSVIVQGEIICSVFFEETHMMGLERTKSHIIYIYIRKDITSKKKTCFQ